MMYIFITFTIILLANDVMSRSLSHKPSNSKVFRLNHQQWYDILTPKMLTSNNQPQPQPQSVTSMHLESNEIMDIEDDTFDAFPQLTDLNLSNNMLTNLTARIDALEYLDLSYNFLFDEKETIVRRYPSLVEVNFAYNQFTTVDWTLDKFEPSKSSQLQQQHNLKCNLKILNVSHNINLKSFKLTSQSVEELYLEGLELENLYLDTPNLKILNARDTKFGDNVSYQDICSGNLSDEFRIISSIDGYVFSANCEELSSREFFSTENDLLSNDIEGYVRPGKESNKDCSGFKLVNEDDVVLTKQDYLKLELLYVSMLLLIIILLIHNYLRLYLVYRG